MAVNSLMVLLSIKLYEFFVALVLATLCYADARSCTTTRDCSAVNGEQCCRGVCNQTVTCLGNECRLNDECSTSQVCCNRKCVSNWNCLGETCSSNAHCQRGETCCYGSCREEMHCVEVTGAIIVYSTAVILFVLICSCVCRDPISRNPLRQQIPGSSTTVIIPAGIKNELPSSGDWSNYPQKIKCYSTLQISFEPGNEGPLPLKSENVKGIDGVKRPTLTLYGSTCEAIEPLVGTSGTSNIVELMPS